MASRQEWAEWAVEGIILPRERESAKQELLDHMEDHMEALVAAGFSREDAEAHAVLAMGDPKDTARLLRKAHQPVLSGLLQIVRATALLFLLIAFIAYGLLTDGLRKPLRTDPRNDPEFYYSWTAEDDPAEEGWHRKLYIYDQPPAKQVGDYRISLERAAFFRIDPNAGPQGSYAALMLLLDVEDLSLPKDPALFDGLLTMTDDQGNRFSFPYSDGSDNQVICSAGENFLRVRVHYWEPLERDPQWVDFTYQKEDVTVTFRAQLTGEVLP